MITSRIIDNDMGAVIKVALTGRGTVHGLTFAVNGTKLPEFEVGLTELISGDGGAKLFEDHLNDHGIDEAHIAEALKNYKTWVEPIIKSGKSRY